MKRILFPLALALAMLATAGQAQESKSTTRFERQHKPPSSMGTRVAEYEVNLLKSLETGNQVAQAQAVQTIRDLEQMFPAYSFAASLAPLEKKLKDANADPVVRALAALALDELHSDAGDSVIRDVANSVDDKGLQNLCKSLLVRSDFK